MSSSRLKVAVAIVQLVGASLLAPAAWAVFDEPQKGAKQEDAAAATPEAQAALDAALTAVKEAEVAEGSAAKKAYAQARAKFEEATKADPKLSQAWNGLGYSSRKLGDYKAALVAYDKALELRSGDYPEATEYRGEAYLSLNRIEDAKQAYLDLFASNRPLADKLLSSMKQWVASPGKKKADVADLSEFITEREKIASQVSASLTRESAARGWN